MRNQYTRPSGTGHSEHSEHSFLPNAPLDTNLLPATLHGGLTLRFGQIMMFDLLLIYCRLEHRIRTD